MQLKDKVIIITGGARGLGKAYAEAMSAEGANIVIGDVADCSETVAAVEAAGGQIAAATLDVADMASCQAIADLAVDKFGRIDGLVNNAALYGNLKGMRQAAGGSIVNISSLAAVYGLPYGLDYAMSKAAVIGMTRSMSRELGRDLIRVNSVAPSAVKTEGTTEFMGEKLDKALQVIASGQAIQKNLNVDDLTGTVIYLTSDASKFVTGQTLMVDGGTVLL
jgi:3-oxoacyl-[acyl-carrier protein] reductase